MRDRSFMSVYHFFKADCFGASRIMLQASWDQASSFVHRPKRESHKADRRIQSRVLGVWEVLKVLWAVRQGSAALVFHGQATLPYLLIAYMGSRFARRSELRIVYDMHDLHERWEYSGFLEQVRYGVFRYLALRGLERLVFGLNDVFRMTVSNGLARVVAQRYRCAPPEVVRSAPPPVFEAAALQGMKRLDNAILYFGLLDHAPLQFIDVIGQAGLKIDLYGRDITRDSLRVRLGYDVPSFVNVCGPYTPENMDFLERYAFLLLYKPEDETLNYRYALPNKLFQSLGYGVSVLYSGNFVELGEFISDVDGAGAAISGGDDFVAALRMLDSCRDQNYFEGVVSLCRDANEGARRAYSKVVLG